MMASREGKYRGIAALFLGALLCLAAPVRGEQAGRRDTVLSVQPGDTLSRLASRLLPLSSSYTRGELVEQIKRYNGLHSDALRPGQQLRVSLGHGESPERRARREKDFAARGLYVSARMAGSQRVVELVEELLEAGGNTLVFDVKDRLGNLGYASRVDLAQAIGADTLAPIEHPLRLIDLLHRRGIHTVARLVCFYDARLAGQRPDLAPLARGGGPWSERAEPTWVDPSLPEVQDYLLDLIDEVVAMGVDEVQLDYVRFPTGSGAGEAVFAFDAEEVSRQQVITAFVERVRQRLQGTEVLLSADLFGVVAWGQRADAESTGQDLEGLLPHLDVVSPMLYPSHFERGFIRIPSPVDYPYFFLYQGCRRMGRLAAAHQVVVRPWIQAFPYRVENYDPAYVAEQLYGAQDAGARGWLLWNPANRYEVGLAGMALFARGAAPADSALMRQRFPEHMPFPGELGAHLPEEEGVAD